MKVIDVHPDELLDRELRGTLSGEERAHLEQHLAHCVACRMERALRSDFAAEDDLADDAIQAHLSGVLAAAHQARPPAPAAPRRVSRGAIAAAAAVLLASGLATAQTGLPALLVQAVTSVRESTRVLLGEPPSEPRVPARKRAAKAVPATPAPVVTPPVEAEPRREEPAEPPPRGPETRVPAPSIARERAHRHAPPDRGTVAPTPQPALRSTPPETRIPAIVPVLPDVPRSEAPPRSETLPSADPSADTSKMQADAVAVAFERANGLRRERRAQEARAAYRELALLHPRTAEGRLALALAARLALDEGDARAALVDFDAYLGTGDRALREQALAGRALALLKLERAQDACAAFGALLAAYPSSTYAPLARQRCTPEHGP